MIPTDYADNVRATLIKRAEIALNARRMTKKEAAKKAGLAENTLRAGLDPNGRRQMSLVTGALLADALEVPLDWLCGLSDDREPELP